MKFSDEQYGQIIRSFLDTDSVQKTAEELKISTVKVRKVLITEELWSSRTSVLVQHYLNLGMKTSQIAGILSTTEKAVQQYLPYTRGLYNGDHPTVAALNSADYRERIRVAREKTLRKKYDFFVNEKWKETIGENDTEYKEGKNVKKKKPDPVRLHLELGFSPWAERQDAEELSETLKKYGGVKYGETITRDVIVPDTMPLWALNYVIQKCFGWQNSHLHCFELPEDRLDRICDGESSKFIELVGVAFRSPWMGEEEEFWTDDYEKGSFRNWLRKKYTGPYESLCHGEGIWQCRQDVAEIKDRIPYVRINRKEYDSGIISYDWPETITKKKYTELKTKCPVEIIAEDGFYKGEKVTQEVFTFNKIPLEAMKKMFDRNINNVLERLSVSEVFAKAPECFDEIMTEEVRKQVKEYRNIDEFDVQPCIKGLTDELIYSYDFGDDWKVRVTKNTGAEDLIESGRLNREEYVDAVALMQETYRPLCIAQDGMNVLDDVGGIWGYAQFLKGINQPDKQKSLPDDEEYWDDDEYDEDEKFEKYGLYSDKEESLIWARSLGWSKRKISNKNVL